MNENIDPNLTNAEQSSQQEEITEPNCNETNDTAASKTKNFLRQKAKPELIADGTMDLPPTKEEFSSEVIV